MQRVLLDWPPVATTPPEPRLTTELGQLFQADCLQWLPTLPPDSVDCVFADPPFNLGKHYDGAGDARTDDDYLAWARRWLDELVRVLRPGGSLLVYNLPRWAVPLAAHLMPQLTFRHWIAVDIKFSLPIRGRLYPSHYALLYFVKGPRPRVFHPTRQPLQTCRHCGGEIKDYGGYKNRMNPRGVNLTDVWSDIPPVRHRKYKTRAANELSLKMLHRVLSMATDPGDLVLDPFGGSGTTFAAAELMGRPWLGCEIGDCGPVVERFADLSIDRAQLQAIERHSDVLFTEQALALRQAHGHDTSRYRVDEIPRPDSPEEPQQSPPLDEDR